MQNVKVMYCCRNAVVNKSKKSELKKSVQIFLILTDSHLYNNDHVSLSEVEDGLQCQHVHISTSHHVTFFNK